MGFPPQYAEGLVSHCFFWLSKIDLPVLQEVSD
jgi:hypothetical protein